MDKQMTPHEVYDRVRHVRIEAFNLGWEQGVAYAQAIRKKVRILGFEITLPTIAKAKK